MTALRLLLPLYLGRWRRAGATLALALVTAAAGLALLGVSGWFLSAAALAGSLLTFNLFVPSALIRTFSFLRIGARYAERLVGHDTTLRLLADLRVQAFTRIMDQSAGQLMRLREGDALSTLTQDIDVLDSVFLSVGVPLLVALTAGGALTAIWWPHSAAAAWTMGATTATTVLLLPALVARAAFRHGAAQQRSWRQARQTVLTAVQAHADLTALGAQRTAMVQFESALHDMHRARSAQTRAAAWGQSLLQALTGLGVLGALVGGLAAWQTGSMAATLLVGWVLATLGFFELVLPVVRQAARLGAAQAGAQRVAATLATRADLTVAHPVTPVPASGTLAMTDIVLDHGRQRPVFDGLSLMLRAGERVALVGPSGSGKSSLLHLIMRLQDPQSGVLRYGGHDLRSFDPAHWHRRVALLSQDAPVFLGTVRTNLLIARPEASDAELWTALRQARLAQDVAAWPDGLDTWTGDTGTRLSAGQARRLCLARVLLSDAALWLLDEPTCGLDDATAQAFLQTLSESAAGRTVLMATHAHLPAFSVDRVIDLGTAASCVPLPRAA